MQRIQKLIALSGVCSRRKAEELIKEGKVSVNGKIITELGFKAEESDNILVNGKSIAVEHKVYYLLNKPSGVISSVKDEKDRTTVVDLIDEKKRIFPIGRLDYDTSGLILLTNDGELANILMHPRNEVPKTYVAKIEGILSMEEYYKLKKGIMIDDFKVIPERLKIVTKNPSKNTCIVKITICEGRNHIVKRIFSSLNHEVIKLKRENYGFLTLTGLNPGEYRKLTNHEIEDLYTYKK